MKPAPHENPHRSPNPPSERETPLAPLAPGKALLPRVLGPFDAVMVVVGGIIGSGIFLKIGRIDGYLGDYGFAAIMAVWIVAGIVTLCGALALAELAAMLPHAGGPYVYLREAYGRPAAFLWGWTEFSIVRTGSLGSLACGTIIYFNAFLKSLADAGYAPEWLAARLPLSHFSQGLLTVAAVLLLSWINIIGTRWSARTQNVTTIIKVGFLVLLIFGPWLVSSELRVTPEPIWTGELGVNFWKAFGLAMVAVFWPYDGWINIGPIAEEVREPQRNVPLGLGVGMLVVILVYVGANIGYHQVLTIGELKKSEAVAQEVFAAMNWPLVAMLAPLGVMVSTFGALNSNLLAGPRIYFSMARDNLFPKLIGDVHPRFHTPANAILAQTLWSLLQIALVYLISANPKDAFDNLTDFVILGGTIFYALTVGAVYVLRWKMPDQQRPYRTWGYPVTPALYLLAAVGVSYSSNMGQVLAVSALMGLGLCVYGVFLMIEHSQVNRRLVKPKRKKRK